jgi:hypothetical protein
MSARLAACLLIAVGVALPVPAAHAASRIEASRALAESAQAARPSKILIYNFDASPERVELRLTGLNAATADTSTPEQRAQAGRRAANYLADALWKALQARGAPAQRATGQTRVPEGALVVRGRVLSVDEGDRAKGAASPMAAMPVRVRVQFDAYQGPSGAPQLHWQARVATTSQALGADILAGTGLAEAAGRITGLAIPGAGGSQGEGDPVVRYAAEMAEAIAGELWNRFGEQGWVKD